MTKEEKYRAFAAAVVAAKSNREAAILAGYKVETASQSGSRLAKDPEIIRLIAEMTDKTPNETTVQTHTNAETTEQQLAPNLEDPPYKRAIRKGEIIELDGKQYNTTDPKDMLTLAMLGVISPSRAQLDAAKALIPFVHGKVGDQGKKESELERARGVIQGGRFQALDAPAPIQMSLIN